MFGKLKDLAGKAGVQSVVDKMTPLMMEELEKIKSIGPDKINDDAFFKTMISNPAWMLVSSTLGGIDKLYPPLEQKFGGMMLHMRNELVVATATSVSLVEGFQAKLPDVMLEGLKQA